MLKHRELVEFLKGTQPIADNQTAAKAVFLYPEWQAGLEVKRGYRLQCEGLLYKSLQDHTTQDNWKPSQATASRQVKEEISMGIMNSFNDEAGKFNDGRGQYRVMQVVLREKFVGKGSKNFSEIEDICN